MKRMAVFLSVGLLVACGSDGGDDHTPSEKCQVVQNTLCDRAAECIHAMHPECVTEVNFTSQNCDGITAVAESYDTCLEQIVTGTCEVLFPGRPGVPPISPPALCQGTFMH